MTWIEAGWEEAERDNWKAAGILIVERRLPQGSIHKMYPGQLHSSNSNAGVPPDEVEMRWCSLGLLGDRLR